MDEITELVLCRLCKIYYLKSDFKAIILNYIILLPKNIICLFDSQIKIYIIQCVQLTCA